MTDVHWPDAEIERIWEELASGTIDGPLPYGDDRNALLRLFQLTQEPPPARARYAVDRNVRPLMEQRQDLIAAPIGIPITSRSSSPNGKLPMPLPVARGDDRRYLPRHFGVTVSLMAALLLLVGGGGFYLLSDRAEKEPPAIPAAIYREAAIGSQTVLPARLLWETDEVANPILEPKDISIDPDGHIWVSDGVSSNFKILDRDGVLLETWGDFGDGPGEFNFNAFKSGGAAAFDAEGNLYVADIGNYRIQKFDRNREFLASWGSEGLGNGQFRAAVDIEVDGQGRVFVVDLERNIIQVFDDDGTFLFQFGGTGSVEGQLVQPSDIAIDPTGHVWVVDSGNNRIQMFDGNGNVQKVVGSYGSEPGQFMLPHGIDIDAQGRVFVVEIYGYRGQVLNSEGEPLGVFGEWGTVGEWGTDGNVFQELEDIAVGEDGGIYVVDLRRNSLQKFQVV